MNPRKVLELMARTDRGNMTVWSPDEVRTHIDAYRAEVLAEAAAELDRIADTVEARVAEHYGPASGIGPGSAQMLRDAAGNVRYMARKDTREGESTVAAPDFQPGRTYTYGGDGFTAPELLTWFRAEHITTHPDTGKRTAFGWARRGDEQWVPFSEPDDDFAAFTLQPEDGAR